MSAATVAARRGSGRRRDRCSRRCSSASSSTGRRGCRDAAAPAPLQPYRELRRLWGKSTVDGRGHDARLPARAGASPRRALVAAVLLVPAAAAAPDWGVGHDALALAGLLALARFAVAAASWDVANGFSLMGASRDLTSRSSSRQRSCSRSRSRRSSRARPTCVGMVAGTAGTRRLVDARRSRSAAVAFALVVIAETGRQPVDNPDTHLELTMIHEGPLLEYGGRDLAFLQWAAAARHWLVLVLAAQVFLPHPASVWWQLGAPARSCSSSLCAALALTETLVAKMRILLVPRLLAVGAAVALLGIVAWLVETT